MAPTDQVIVVGGGLFGSAAARHLAEAGWDTTVVTSPESVVEPGAGVWAEQPRASHYDQGRIVRRGGSRPFMVEAGSRSMDRFGDVATRSGSLFLTPRSVVTLTDEPEQEVTLSRAHGADVDIWSLDDVSDRFGIAAPPGFVGRAVVESSLTAGFVNPRLLIEAQLSLAIEAGATIVDRPARQVSAGDGHRAAVSVETVDGHRINGDRLLLTTGPYGAELLGLDLSIQRRLRTVALIELDGADDVPVDELPSLSASGFLHPDPNHPALEETYWVPPVRYPDGGTYLKIGGNSLPMITAADNDDIGRWFHQGGSEREAEALFALACDLLPHRSLRLAGHKPCVVSSTADELPIVQRVDDRVVVALAGNGSGATISEEIGRRAAAMTVAPHELAGS